MKIKNISKIKNIEIEISSITKSVPSRLVDFNYKVVDAGGITAYHASNIVNIDNRNVDRYNKLHSNIPKLPYSNGFLGELSPLYFIELLCKYNGFKIMYNIIIVYEEVHKSWVYYIYTPYSHFSAYMKDIISNDEIKSPSNLVQTLSQRITYNLSKTIK